MARDEAAGAGVDAVRSTGGRLEGASPSSIVTAAGVGWLSSRPRLLVATRLAELAVSLAIAVLTLHPGTSGATPALWATSIASLGWLGWIVAGDRRAAGAAALLVMAAAGGVLAASRGVGLIYVGVSASAAAFTYELPVALALVCSSPGAFVITTGIDGTLPRHLFRFISIPLLGAVSGLGRRQLMQHGRQVTLVATAEQRAVIALRDAELLAERNRLGREMHDVLAHTLGAVSIQLTALDSRVGAGDDAVDVRARIATIHRLVDDGLGEARDAVLALRDEGPLLDAQLKHLCRLHGADLEVSGRFSPIGSQGSLALYRTVQEALTNVDKHAPQARVSVQLRFNPGAWEVCVDNTASPLSSSSRLAGAGGGHGLRGMRERLALVGGRVYAGPLGEGWRVRATVPRRDEGPAPC